jgi:hypothetical protein
MCGTAERNTRWWFLVNLRGGWHFTKRGHFCISNFTTTDTQSRRTAYRVIEDML